MNNEETATQKQITHFCEIRISYKRMFNADKEGKYGIICTHIHKRKLTLITLITI